MCVVYYLTEGGSNDIRFVNTIVYTLESIMAKALKQLHSVG